MKMELQPILENDLIKLKPLQKEDFKLLFAVASDPLIWEQHPDKFRYKRKIFKIYFESAIESKAAFLIYDKKSNSVAGCSRYYAYEATKCHIAIGYTFLARQYWGLQHNKSLKKLMLNYIFTFVETVVFHVGENNIRSQKAIEKTGALFYTQTNENLEYKLSKEKWLKGEE